LSKKDQIAIFSLDVRKEINEFVVIHFG